ncbi:hypothetical protein TL16_g08610 [Triparma laevis f. inornata]|uniref:Uncharacterized protein n=1 Tax=Triparma laevis f. inornata TaxID=1714386 RepID=A0A9W7B6N7_9STRA|nr:hypothetical protein TL16_g08610 [Triparma laevis f. inornata]
MSKPVTSDTNDSHKSREMSGERGTGDEGGENEEGTLDLPPAESLTVSTVVSTVPTTTDQFMRTPKFRRHFVKYVPRDTLITLRLVTKGWKAAAEALIDEGVRSGELMVHGGNDISSMNLHDALRARHMLVTRVVFLLNITKVGEFPYKLAVNLVVIDIPESVERIGKAAFNLCRSFTTVSFPMTLT